MKDFLLSFLKSDRFNLVWLLYAVLLTVSFLTRTVLLIHSADLADLSFINIAGIFTVGLLYDLINAGYFTIPCVFYVWLLPEHYFRKPLQRFIIFTLFFLFTLILLFNATAEYFFWEEFGTRFNFIAVDYLVYTTEVIGNINESYPMEWIIGGIVLLAFIITFLSKDLLVNSHPLPIRFSKRTFWTALLFVIPVLSFLLMNSSLHNFSNNTYTNELAGNGMYELFAAYRNNELDYDRFYPHIADAEAVTSIKEKLSENIDEIESRSDLSICHEVKSEASEKRLNVVLISVESLSAEFMNLFGNQKNLTPFLDSLGRHSLSFTNLYATGTRTVRGLEALSLSVPPTPGQSIVRRPDNEHLFTLASVFNQKGYESKFLYGGYGYFDNMNYFFGNNGYTVVDRNSLSADEIDYENVWVLRTKIYFHLAFAKLIRPFIPENMYSLIL